MRVWPFLAITGALAVVFLLSILAIPVSDELRFQQFDRAQNWRTRWAYDRIHHDPRSIDIALIGASQTLYGVSAPLLEARLAAAGFPGVRVADLGLIEPGEDLHALMLDHLLSHKRPGIVILGVTEQMSQASHPTFGALASPKRVLSQTFAGNRSYFSNLTLAVYTQIQLAVIGGCPPFFGYDRAFRPQGYSLVSDDATGNERLPDGHNIDHVKAAEPNQIEHDLPAAVRHMHGKVYSRMFAPVQFGVPRAAYDEMVRQSAGQGAKTVFLYQPLYKGQARPNEYDFFAALGPVVEATQGKDDPRLFSDTNHRNQAGAAVVTSQLADWLLTHERQRLAEIVRGARPAPGRAGGVANQHQLRPKVGLRGSVSDHQA